MSQWSCEVEHGLHEEDRGLTEEENGVTEEGEGLYDNFVQNKGEDGQLQQKPRYEHGSKSDDSDYELYDEENDVAIEDDHLFDDTVVLTPLEIRNVEIIKEFGTLFDMPGLKFNYVCFVYGFVAVHI
ncbi:hypothetical protein M0R45_007208 [Rubus argutus]|uniref:Uncharacterized protein n=1 Tax=Rubus argutus TaxID=59490 RepID=A0AAW1Y0G3_RUBAR